MQGFSNQIPHHQNILGNFVRVSLGVSIQKWHGMVKNFKTWREILFIGSISAIRVSAKRNSGDDFICDFSLYRVSCVGIIVFVELQRQFSRNFVHYKYQNYTELQENGSAESTREIVSEKISFL